MSTRSQRIREAFNNLRAESLEILDDFYSPTVLFQDPIGEVKGLPALKRYYGQMYENVLAIRFEATDEIVQGSAHVLVWTMYLRARGLKKGNEVALDGISVLHFDSNELVSYHRDYFDMGAFIYTHVPILGRIIRTINRRLEGPRD